MTRSTAHGLAVLLLFGVAACSPKACAERAAEEAIEAETGAKVDIDAEGGELTIRGPEGTEVRMAGSDSTIELPKDFPDTVPVYPGAVPFGFLGVGSEGMQVSFRTEAAAGEVQNWYVEQLGEQGWQVQMNATTAEGGMLMAELDGSSLMVNLSPGEDEPGTTLVLTFQRKD